jgi:hypothetical protein
MLYNPTPEPEQVRYRCRNPRCGGKLKMPAANSRDAFCCASCEASYYRTHCRVCEQLFSRKTQRREVCGRSRCRHEFQRHPERFWGTRYPRQALGHNAEKKLTKSTPKTGAKFDRGWRQIAGPQLSPTSFHCAILPLEIPPAAANVAFAEYWAKTLRRAARRALIKRTRRRSTSSAATNSLVHQRSIWIRQLRNCRSKSCRRLPGRALPTT